MQIARYLPSAQFTLIVASIAISGGLVIAADAFTNREETPSALVPTNAVTQKTNEDWLKTLREIQAQNSKYTLPKPPSENAVQTLLAAAESSNVTETIGRTLLVNLSNAKAQGLGNDIPTQDKLIATAAAQLLEVRGTPRFTTADLSIVPTNTESLHLYGNSVIATMQMYPDANYYQTLISIGQATDANDKTKLAPLAGIGRAYSNTANALAQVPVPETYAPLHLQIVNNLARVGDLYVDLQLLVEDPLRGLSALQLYESLMQESTRVFTNIAQQLSKDAIIFDKNEPGSAWASLLP